MIHKESEDMSFRVSWLKKFKGMVKQLDLCNMEQIMEKQLEESMERNMGNMEKKWRSWRKVWKELLISYNT